jgi:hypothetical protein
MNADRMPNPTPFESSTMWAPVVVTALGLVLLAGAACAGLGAWSLAYPDSPVNAVWSLKPDARHDMLEWGPLAIGGLVAIAVLTARAGLGLLTRHRWGWRLALMLVALNLLGDLVRAYLGHMVAGLTGAVIAGTLCVLLLRPPVRQLFKRP